MLSALATELRHAIGILHKKDIQPIAEKLGHWVTHNGTQTPILLGDDCAAIPDGDSYLLLAAEAMLPLLVETEPWFAGWCSVLVNVSDIYAMGGRPLAVVDMLWSQSSEHAQLLWDGMIAAAHAFNVPIVGGHTNSHSNYDALSVAILGRAKHLVTSFNARPDDMLLLITDFNGKAHPKYPFWDAATHASPTKLQRNLSLLPQIAEMGLCDAGKDISMGGLVGTLLMLLETSGCGAELILDAVPYPAALSLNQWLLSFPSYGFLLSVRSHCVEPIQSLFHAQDLTCEVIGHVTSDRTLVLQAGQERCCFWDLATEPLTGFRTR